MITSNHLSSEPSRGVWRWVIILVQFIIGFEQLESRRLGHHCVENRTTRYLDVMNLFLACILPGDRISPLVVFSGM
jgi:hypothetical protein